MSLGIKDATKIILGIICVELILMLISHVVLLLINQCAIPPPSSPDDTLTEGLWALFLLRDPETCSDSKLPDWVWANYNEFWQGMVDKFEKDSVDGNATLIYQSIYISLHTVMLICSIILITRKDNKSWKISAIPWIIICDTTISLDIIICAFYINLWVEKDLSDGLDIAVLIMILIYSKGILFLLLNIIAVVMVIYTIACSPKENDYKDVLKKIEHSKSTRSLYNEQQLGDSNSDNDSSVYHNNLAYTTPPPRLEQPGRSSQQYPPRQYNPRYNEPIPSQHRSQSPNVGNTNFGYDSSTESEEPNFAAIPAYEENPRYVLPRVGQNKIPPKVPPKPLPKHVKPFNYLNPGNDDKGPKTLKGILTRARQGLGKHNFDDERDDFHDSDRY